MNFNLNELSESIFDYITFGKQIENVICEALIKYFKRGSYLAPPCSNKAYISHRISNRGYKLLIVSKVF